MHPYSLQIKQGFTPRADVWRIYHFANYAAKNTGRPLVFQKYMNLGFLEQG